MSPNLIGTYLDKTGKLTKNILTKKYSFSCKENCMETISQLINKEKQINFKSKI